MNLYERYLLAKENVKKAEEELTQLQCELYVKFESQLPKDTGTFSTEDGDFKIKIEKKESITVDQKLASVVGIAFRTKYELDKKEYKNLSDEDKKRVDECLTTKPVKPSFTVEKIVEGEVND